MALTSAGNRQGTKGAFRRRPMINEGDGLRILLVEDEPRPADAIDGIRILAVTATGAAARIRDTMLVGARGHLLTGAVAAHLKGAIGLARRGGPWLSRDALTALLDGPQPTVKPQIIPVLTPKDKAVLELLSAELSYEQIAVETRTSINTVRTHIRSLYEKLGVGNQAGAVNQGWLLGLLT